MQRTFVRVALILALTLVVVYFFAREVSQVYALYQENERIKSKTEELESSNEEFKKKIKLLKEDKLYIEKVAREELGMIKQGEKVYRFEE